MKMAVIVVKKRAKTQRMYFTERRLEALQSRDALLGIRHEGGRARREDSSADTDTQLADDQILRGTSCYAWANRDRELKLLSRFPNLASNARDEPLMSQGTRLAKVVQVDPRAHILERIKTRSSRV